MQQKVLKVHSLWPDQSMVITAMRIHIKSFLIIPAAATVVVVGYTLARLQLPTELALNMSG